jgi:hypothetical protein
MKSGRLHLCPVGNSWIQFARGSLKSLAPRAGWVYVALMDATVISIEEWTAQAAGSLCFGMLCLAVRSDLTHSG